MNIIPDTHLVGDQYNWLGSVFYIGYLVAEYPANGEKSDWLVAVCEEHTRTVKADVYYVRTVLLQRLPIAKFVSSQIIIWGVILMLHVG